MCVFLVHVIMGKQYWYLSFFFNKERGKTGRDRDKPAKSQKFSVRFDPPEICREDMSIPSVESEGLELHLSNVFFIHDFSLLEIAATRLDFPAAGSPRTTTLSSSKLTKFCCSFSFVGVSFLGEVEFATACFCIHSE